MDKLDAYFHFDWAFASFSNPYYNKKHVHTFVARLDGNQEAPKSVETKAYGYGKFIYNSKSRELLYYVDYKGLSANETGSHFHIGGSKEAGPIEISVPIGNPKVGSVVLTKEQEVLLFVGKMFFNIHSVNYPAGEIRGQIFPTSHAENDEYISQIVAGQNVENQSKSAKWTAQFINTLPDSSFAVVEKGGKKDSEGKTTPRNYRHLPFKDASGKVDVPHLRNALARMNQIKAVSPSDSTNRIRAAARRVLITAAKKHLPNSQFAKMSEDSVENADIIKEIENAFANDFIQDWKNGLANNKFMGLSAKILDIKEEGAVKFVTLEVGEKDTEFPMRIPMDIHMDGKGKVVSVTLLNNRMPMEAIPDIIKFLKSLV